MNVLALDLSLTSTGVALPGGLPARVRPGDLDGVDRLAWVRDALLDLADNWSPDLVAIEGYAFAVQASRSHAIGELGGVVRLALAEAGHRVLDVPPATVKKYATGNGGAGKPEVTAAAIRRLGYEAHHDDEADALWLQACVLDAAGSPRVEVPKAHREALTHQRVSGKGKARRKHPSLIERVEALALVPA